MGVATPHLKPKSSKQFNLFEKKKNRSGKHELHQMRGAPAWLCLSSENSDLLGVAFFTLYLMKFKHSEENPFWPFLKRRPQDFRWIHAFKHLLQSCFLCCNVLQRTALFAMIV